MTTAAVDTGTTHTTAPGSAPGSGAGSMSLAQARAQFPLAARLAYLDVASRAPMADRVAESLERYMTVCRTQPLPKYEWLDEVEVIRARMARLLGAAPEQVAFVKSTSDGLNAVAQSLGLGEGDEVIVAPDLEHTNNLYPWLHLRDRGVLLREVAVRDGAFPLEDALESIGPRTRVVTLSSTSFVTGARADLAAIARACHERGVLLVVDGVQEMGAMALDLPATGVDAMAAATQKMLLASYGLGVLYLSEEHADRLRPPFLTRMSVSWDGQHEADLPSTHTLRRGAPRFEVGNPNFAGLFALDGALSILEDVGMPVVEAHILRLARRLIDGLDALGLPLVTPRDAHAGLVVFRVADAEATATRLADEGIIVAVRRGAIRASIHVYNDDEDVDRLLAALTDESV
jgi:selenocysteine lyase/cysteine desulfurase